jgi:hypothetical protein
MADIFSWIAQQIQGAGGWGNIDLHFKIFVDFDWAAKRRFVKNRRAETGPARVG